MIISKNSVHCVDCFEGMKDVPDGSVDLVITDPPYDVDYGEKSKHLAKFGKARQKQVDRDQHFKDSFSQYELLATELFRILKDDTHLYVFCSEKQIHSWIEEFSKAGFKFRNILVWVKNRQTVDMTFGLKYCYKTEFLLFFNKGVKKLNNLGGSNVLNYDTGNDLKHSCQKPKDLLRFLIKNSSDEGDLVFDPFAGSGSTLIASKQAKRKYLGFEIVPEYHKIIIDGLEQRNLNDLDAFMGDVHA